jgi:alkaline phosphatase D
MTTNSGSAISFIWSGDLGSKGYCRNADEGGYSIFKSMQSLNPNFFIANGDMIYADGVCPVQGPIINNTNNQTMTWTNIPGDFKSIEDPSVDWNNITEVRSIYMDHWKYNRNDTYFKEFLRNVSIYSQWDDHEVINDFGSKWPYWNLASVNREGYPNIIKEGTNGFLLKIIIDYSLTPQTKRFHENLTEPYIFLYLLTNYKPGSFMARHCR